MDRKIAERLVAAIARLDAAAGEIGAISDDVEGVDLRTKIRRFVTNVVLDAHEQITLEIAREFPDLHPDRAEIGPGPSPY